MIDQADNRTLPLPGIPPAGVPVDQVETAWQCRCTRVDAWLCGGAKRLNFWVMPCRCGCHQRTPSVKPR